MYIYQDKFKVSVIIPTYNRRELLNYTLLSLLRQTCDKDKFEVIVADDGSIDDSRSVVERYEGLMNIKYLFQEDKGYRTASARNMGIRNAEGEICLFIDSGVLCNNNCIEEHIDFYSRMSHKRFAVIGYVYGFERTNESDRKLIELVDPNDIESSIRKISKCEMFLDIREEHYLKYNDQIHDLPAPWYYFWTCHVSVPRSELFSVELFDENYDGRWGVEDNDLAFRLNKKGVKLSLVRNAQAIHYPHEKNKEERRREGYENCKYFNSKFATPYTRLFLDCYLNHADLVDINEVSMQIQ